MAVDAQKISRWSDELARLSALPAVAVLAEALDLSRAIDEAMSGGVPAAAPENLAKMAELCRRELAVRPPPVPAEAGEAMERIVSGKTGRMWSLALIAEYRSELEELLKQQREASAEAERLEAEAAALRQRRDRVERYADLLDALVGKRPGLEASAAEPARKGEGHELDG